MAEPLRVLVTGATGQLGRTLCAHLRDAAHMEIVPIDLDPRDDSRVFAADLSQPDARWADCFHGVEAVLHLAGAAAPATEWPTVQRANIDLLMHVLDASVAAGVRRFVFASSNFVMSGYRYGEQRLTTGLAPNPTTGYGFSKAAGERICASYARRHGLSVVCLRIGAVVPAGESAEFLRDPWYREMWLSQRDLCQVVERALVQGSVAFAVVNAMSDNVGMRWDLSDTRTILGYQPQDSAPAYVFPPPARFATARAIARRLRGWLRQVREPRPAR